MPPAAVADAYAANSSTHAANNSTASPVKKPGRRPRRPAEASDRPADERGRVRTLKAIPTNEQKDLAASLLHLTDTLPEGIRVRTDRQDLAGVWIEYKNSAPEACRNILMEAYLHLVRFNADRVYAKLPNEVDIEDLISVGIFGLMDAIDQFKFDKDVKFETFCARRIQGAMLDELRSMDWVPRLVRSRAHKLDTAQKALEVQFGRQATAEELAEKLEVDMEEFEKIFKDAQATGLVSLNRKWYETDSNKDVREVDVLEDRRTNDPVREMQRKDLKELMNAGLSRAERLIVTLYYFEEMTMKEIGATLDLSESRVSQMHSSIIARLRDQMATKQQEMAEADVA
jgi:RNA polymerase sigma factor for flagellar operon FliA